MLNVQEEDAQENEQKIESERRNVKEAQDELKNHQRVLMNINQKYKDVKNKMEQLSDETEQLKVRDGTGRSVYIATLKTFDVTSIMFPFNYWWNHKSIKTPCIKVLKINNKAINERCIGLE